MATGNSSVAYSASPSDIYNSLLGQADAANPAPAIMVTNLSTSQTITLQAYDANGATRSGLVTIGPGATQAVIIRSWSGAYCYPSRRWATRGSQAKIGWPYCLP